MFNGGFTFHIGKPLFEGTDVFLHFKKNEDFKSGPEIPLSSSLIL